MNIWLIMILVMVLSFIVQNTLQSRISKYSRVRNSNGMTGAEIASMMLRQNGIYDVRVECIAGQLTDHYNPQTKTVNLSRSVYEGNSIAAAAVAAHECGHVLQHATGYAPLRFRSWLVPVVTLCNSTVQWVLLIGVILINITPFFFNLGIALFATTTLFSFVTLPVEINASYRAINWLTSNNIADSVTKPMAIDALKWAAYTYVIAAIGSLATLLYYIGLASRRD